MSHRLPKNISNAELAQIVSGSVQRALEVRQASGSSKPTPTNTAEYPIWIGYYGPARTHSARDEQASNGDHKQ